MLELIAAKCVEHAPNGLPTLFTQTPKPIGNKIVAGLMAAVPLKGAMQLIKLLQYQYLRCLAQFTACLNQEAHHLGSPGTWGLAEGL